MGSVSPASQQGRNSLQPRCLLPALTLLTLLIPALALGQNFAEWFRQQKTQQKYLLEQIAALRAYGGAVRQGYAIVRQGSGAITEYLDRELQGHRSFYGDKRQVNPELRLQAGTILNDARVVESQLQKLRKAVGFNASEQHYLRQVSVQLRQDCAGQIALLEQVTTEDRLEMSDAERLEVIGRIGQNLQKNAAFAIRFVRQALLYGLRRQRLVYILENAKQNL